MSYGGRGEVSRAMVGVGTAVALWWTQETFSDIVGTERNVVLWWAQRNLQCYGGHRVIYNNLVGKGRIIVL